MIFGKPRHTLAKYRVASAWALIFVLVGGVSAQTPSDAPPASPPTGVTPAARPVAPSANTTEPVPVAMERGAARRQVENVLRENHRELTDAEILDLEQVWDEERPVLDAVFLSFLRFRPEVREMLARLAEQAWFRDLPPAALANADKDAFLRANVGLYFARDLVRRELLDEAIAVFEAIPAAHVVDPATYYFHLAVCAHRLHLREKGLEALDRLESIEEVPERYLATAMGMRVMLENLKPEELDGIAHDMRDLRRRMELGRADSKVQDLEKSVLDRLQKMIKDLEEQQKNASSGGGAQSSNPAQDSSIMGGKGEGKVDAKAFKSKEMWGNLPDKQREKAMQNIGREFPAHYRAAVEEYFRKMATSRKK